MFISLASRGTATLFKIINQNGDDAVSHPSRFKSRGGGNWRAESHIATLNVREGMSDKIEEVSGMISERRIDVLFVNKMKKACGTNMHGPYTP